MNRSLKLVLFYIGLIISAVVFLYPLLFMFAASFKGSDLVFENLASFSALIPNSQWSWNNYLNVLENSNFVRYFFNSLTISLVSVCSTLLVSASAAFAFAKLDWKGRDLMFSLVIALLIVPFEVVAIPLLLIVNNLPWFSITDGLTYGWLNTLHVQIVPFLANAFCIFLLTQFFKDIPDELIEAAIVDGAKPGQVFFRIMLPLSIPALVTAAIIIFLGMWNQYLWPVMTIYTADARPVMVGLQQFFGRANQWGEIMAYASMITLPTLLFFIAFQKYFVRSVVGSGIKG